MSISAIPSSTFNQYPLAAANNVYQQDMKQLAGDLQSGNLSAAQQDFSILQQDLQNQSGSSVSRPHNHHRLHIGTEDLTGQNSLVQQLSQHGQALASGNVAAAQQAYAMLPAGLPASIGPDMQPAREGSTISAMA
jgi:hypothetical protein